MKDKSKEERTEKCEIVNPNTQESLTFQFSLIN